MAYAGVMQFHRDNMEQDLGFYARNASTGGWPALACHDILSSIYTENDAIAEYSCPIIVVVRDIVLLVVQQQ